MSDITPAPMPLSADQVIALREGCDGKCHAAIQALEESMRETAATRSADIGLRVKLINILHTHGNGETDEHDGENISEMVQRLVATTAKLREEINQIEAIAYGAHGSESIEPIGRAGRIVKELGKKCDRILAELDIEHTRTEKLREENATVKRQSESCYDCHGGPGTTQEACGACLTCIMRERDAAREELAQSNRLCQDQESSLKILKDRMNMCRSEADCPDDETLAVHCRTLRARVNSLEKELALTQSKLRDREDQWKFGVEVQGLCLSVLPAIGKDENMFDAIKRWQSIASLQYTSEFPTVPGWYWVMPDNSPEDQTPMFIGLDEIAKDFMLTFFRGCLFAGPIPKPTK